MADKLLKLIIFVLFISFRPVTSDEGLNLKEFNVEDIPDQQDVKEQHTAIETEENQASAAETAETTESKGSPGFFQVLSELAAPLYEEDENDFLSEDNPSANPSSEDKDEDSLSVNPSSEDDSREEHDNKNKDRPSVNPTSEDDSREEDDNKDIEDRLSVNPSPEDDSREEDDNKDIEDSLSVNPSSEDDSREKYVNKEIEEPQFASSEYMSSVTEDSKTGLTVDQQTVSNGNDKKLWPNVASVPNMQSGSTKDTADSEKEHNQVSSEHYQGNGNSLSEKELSDEDLEHLRVKSRAPVKDDVDSTTEEKDPRVETTRKRPEFKASTEDDVANTLEEENPEDTRDKESLELDTHDTKDTDSEAKVDLAVQKDQMIEQDKGKEMDEGTREVLPDQEGRKVAGEEKVEKQQADIGQNTRMAEEKNRKAEEERQLRLESLKKQRAEIEKQEKIAAEQERKREEQRIETLKKEQAEIKWHKKMAEEQKLEEEEERREMEKQAEIEEREKMLKKQRAAIEKRQKIAEEQRLETLKRQQAKMKRREKMAAEQKRKEEEDRQQRLEILKKQQEEIKQHEKMVEEQKRKDREDQQLRQESSRKQQAEIERDQETLKKRGKENKKSEEMAAERMHREKEEKNENLMENQEHGDNRQEETEAGKIDRQVQLDEEELDLRKRLEKLNLERLKFEEMAQEYRVHKHSKQPKVPKQSEHSKQTPAEETPKSPVKKQEVPAKVDQASIVLPVSVTSIMNSWTPTLPVINIAPTKTKTYIPVTSSTAKATEPPVVLTYETIQPTATLAATSSATVTEATPGYSEAAEVSVAPKVNLSETQSVDNATLISAYSTFMVSFRSFHERSFHAFLSYWPTLRNNTRDVLEHVGLDGLFEQLCNDLADVHPAVLFGTFLFGMLGILYLMWSATFGRIQQGAQGPSPRDVLRSKDARVRILEEELKASDNEKLALIHERDTALKEKCICEDQLKDTESKIERLHKEIKRLKKREEEVNDYVTKVTNSHAEAEAEVKEKGQRIEEYENMILELETKIEAKQTEIGKLNEDIQEQQKERQANKQLIDELNNHVEQADVENRKLENMLQEAKYSKQSTQADLDEQLLRMAEMEQQYNFKRDECELLQDCLKQIKVNPTADEDREDEEETDPHEMEKRLEDLMDVAKAKAELKKSLESQRAMESELDEHRKTKKYLENEAEEIREQLVQLKSKADQAALSQREKEIELVALQRYFQSTEVDLHRKLTAEESARINTENQLQSEQAKASTAVVDADKYRQLYLDIKKQIEEIDQSKKEQLSNMEAKAHQNWLDYRAAANEVDALKEENDLLRRKLYDMEVRGSRPSSSASSGQMNHVDGRDSPRQSPMTGPPGHGSPVPFVPMMGPPPPPPPGMFAVPRRHPAEMLMTPPRPPFPPQGHATPPLTTSTPQTFKPNDRDTKDGTPRLPPPPPPPMGGYGPRPMPPMMGMPRFPLPPPMMPPPISGGQGPRIFRPGAPLPPLQMQGPRPSS